jgi:hypothetical protein
MVRVEIDDNLKVDGVVDITHATASDRFPDAQTQICGFVLDQPWSAVVDYANHIPSPRRALCDLCGGCRASTPTPGIRPPRPWDIDRDRVP